MVSSSGPMKQLHGTEIGLGPPQDAWRYIDLTDRTRFSQPSKPDNRYFRDYPNVGRGGLTLDYGEHPCNLPSGTVPWSWGQ
jgi:hypothetical protein